MVAKQILIKLGTKKIIINPYPVWNLNLSYIEQRKHIKVLNEITFILGGKERNQKK